MSVLTFFEWLENTGPGQGIRESVWLFPVVEAFHLVALAALGGAVLLVDLRLLRAVLKDTPVVQVAADAQPWFNRSLALILATGLLLFMSEAVKCYHNTAFWTKMACLAAGIVFALTVRRHFIRSGKAETARGQAALIGIISLGLWITVAISGRWIGFS